MRRDTICALAIAGASLAMACTPAPAAPPAGAPAQPVAPLASITMAANVTSLTALTGSSRVAAGLSDGRVVVWSATGAAPDRTLTPHATRILAVGSTADGGHVWSVASDGTLVRTPVDGGDAAAPIRIDLGAAPTRAAAFASDGATLVTGGEFGEVRVFDTATGSLKHAVHGHRTELQSIAVRTGSPRAATASAESDLRIWDTATGREVEFVEGELSLFALDFSPRDGTLAAGGVNRRLTLHDPHTFAAVADLALPPPRMVASLAWSPDGRFIAMGDIDDETLSKGGVAIVDAASRAVIARLDTGGAPASALAVVGSGPTVVAVVGRELRAWAVPTLK